VRTIVLTLQLFDREKEFELLPLNAPHVSEVIKHVVEVHRGIVPRSIIRRSFGSDLAIDSALIHRQIVEIEECLMSSKHARQYVERYGRDYDDHIGQISSVVEKYGRVSASFDWNLEFIDRVIAKAAIAVGVARGRLVQVDGVLLSSKVIASMQGGLREEDRGEFHPEGRLITSRAADGSIRRSVVMTDGSVKRVR
jgi:hypothetical protein